MQIGGDDLRFGVVKILEIGDDPAEGGVLKKLVRECLEYRYALAVRGFKTALPKDGGEGATLVTLR